MAREPIALLVHDPGNSLDGLEQGLRNQGMETQKVHHCSEASLVLDGPREPELVFTGPTLADGTWADVLNLAHRNHRGIPVIVVSRVVDINLYLETMDGGACDFIVPPVSTADLAHVVKAALWKRASSKAAMAVDAR